MKVVITGATGFIGTALCTEMLDAGHQVTTVIRPGTPKRSKLPTGISVIELNLDQLYDLHGSFDVFYHLAWNGSSGEVRSAFDSQYKNIVYTTEAVQAAKRCQCKKFIGAGSQAEYGMVRGMCTEETVPKPFMMYGAAKLAAYHMGKIVAAQDGISFVWPRIYSVYGVGENSGTLISYLIETLLAGKEPKLSNCENIWDFMYITDCVKALRLLGEQSDTEGIYNVSSGNPRVLKAFVEEIRDTINPDIGLLFGEKITDPNQTFWLQPDISRLKDIGFLPIVDFRQGIMRVLSSLPRVGTTAI